MNLLYGDQASYLWVCGIIVQLNNKENAALISFPARFEAHWRKASYFQDKSTVLLSSQLTGKKVELTRKLFISREGKLKEEHHNKYEHI